MFIVSSCDVNSFSFFARGKIYFLQIRMQADCCFTAKALEEVYYYETLAKQIKNTLYEKVFSWGIGEEVLVPFDDKSSCIVDRVINAYRSYGFECYHNATHIFVRGYNFEKQTPKTAEINLSLLNLFVTASHLFIQYSDWIIKKIEIHNRVNILLKSRVAEWFHGSLVFVPCQIESKLADILVALYTEHGFQCESSQAGLSFARVSPKSN